MRQPEQETHASIGLPEIYYVLFRHKWKILTFTAIGIIGAIVVFLLRPPLYVSEAKLFIRYVQDARLPTGMAGNAQITSPDRSGDNIINSEAEVLTSLDLALQVVDAVGPEKILPKSDTTKDRYAAAGMVRKNIMVEVPKRSDVLKVTFQHPNPEVPQQVLEKLVTLYLKKHFEIHRTPGMIDDALNAQTDSARTKLLTTESDLKMLKKKAGIINIEETKRANSEANSHLRQEILNSEAELAEREATLTNMVANAPATSTNRPAADLPVPPEIVSEYEAVTAAIQTFRRKEQELILQFGDENTLLKTVRSRIADNEKYQRKLMSDYPTLSKFQSPVANAVAASALISDPDVEKYRIMALRTKIQTLRTQLTNVTAEAAAINEIEPTINELERRKQLEEGQFKYFYSSLQQARFDVAIGEGKLTNINVTETATPAGRDTGKTLKIALGILAGSCVFGLMLAFLIEFYLDQSVRRPSDIENKLKLPLFLSIPHTSELMARNGQLKLKSGDTNSGAVAELNGSAAVAPWDENHSLRVFCEALRDRVVTYFEVRNLTHKPKLVAVTGCATGAGVTTLAAGLAAALSETGDGNVLLVDMNVHNGAAHPFFKGKPSCPLNDALEGENRDDAMVNENLYVVSGSRNANGDKLPSILPKRFSQLMPKLKASDYDYIIFDMPPVSQTSVTPRLATYMDMTLLVLESEKTNREVVKRATALLGESKANVIAILNKTHNYVPRKLHQEFLNNA
ncbi:MAG: Tyrosine-protein kinase ptk [Verrucomicrobiales bacterium]|nr:Tyrosine-protein kinase ptk [Verrucomicrobiales bacterium]